MHTGRGRSLCSLHFATRMPTERCLFEIRLQTAPSYLCFLNGRFSEHFSECLTILSGFYCTVGQAYRPGTKRCVSGLLAVFQKNTLSEPFDPFIVRGVTARRPCRAARGAVKVKVLDTSAEMAAKQSRRRVTSRKWPKKGYGPVYSSCYYSQYVGLERLFPTSLPLSLSSVPSLLRQQKKEKR